MGYRSENKFIRYASYIALGCAAGIKLYPAILWLLIVRERRYREAGICMLVVLALVLVPFIFTDGDPMMLFDVVMDNTGRLDGRPSYFTQLVSALQGASDLSDGTLLAMGYTVNFAFALLSFAVVLFDREMKPWKIIAILSCNIILGPGTGYPYNFVYMMMPMMFFFASEKEMTRENLFYLVFFTCVMALMPDIGYLSPVQSMVNMWMTLTVLTALLCEGCRRICRERFGNRTPKSDPQ
jgi:hypothetical protein